MRLTATKLRKKYPHARRACDASGADVPEEYCVGGALCIEVFGQKAMHFPDYDRLLQAVLRANDRIDYHAMSDKQFTAFRSKLSEIDARNDIGDFDGAWRALEELLNWPA